MRCESSAPASSAGAASPRASWQPAVDPKQAPPSGSQPTRAQKPGAAAAANATLASRCGARWKKRTCARARWAWDFRLGAERLPGARRHLVLAHHVFGHRSCHLEPMHLHWMNDRRTQHMRISVRYS